MRSSVPAASGGHHERVHKHEVVAPLAFLELLQQSRRQGAASSIQMKGSPGPGTTAAGGRQASETRPG